MIRELLGLGGTAEKRGRLFDGGTLSAPSTQILDFLGSGSSTAAGVTVTPATALGYPVVYSAVAILAEGVGILPLKAYMGSGRERVEARDRPEWYLVHERPNPDMTPITFWCSMLGQKLLRRFAIAEIVFDERGRGKEVWPLPSSCVERKYLPKKDGKGRELWFRYMPLEGGEAVWLPPWKVVYLPDFGFGPAGWSRIQILKEAIGRGLAVSEFVSSFFKYGSAPAGILSHDGELTQPEADKIRADWERQVLGKGKAWRAAVLDSLVTWQDVGASYDDSKFLKSEEVPVKEVARVFRVPLHLLMESLGTSSYNATSQASLEFVKRSLMVHLLGIEQELNFKLAPGDARGKLRYKYVLQSMLRGDVPERMQMYAAGRQWGFLSPNDIRGLEEWPLLGPDGDVLLQPVNMVPLGWGSDTEPGADRGGDPSPERRSALQLRSLDERWRLRGAYQPLFETAGGRLIKKQVQELAAGLRKASTASQMREFLDSWSARGQTFAEREFGPVLASYHEAVAGSVGAEVGVTLETLREQLERFERDYLSAFAMRQVSGVTRQLLALIGELEDDLEQARRALEERMEEWEDRSPAKLASEEGTRGIGAIPRMVYAAAGYQFVRWAANQGACPLCLDMDGRTAPVSGAFLSEGDTVQGEGAEPLTVNGSIAHPPLHGGCTCTLTAG